MPLAARAAWLVLPFAFVAAPALRAQSFPAAQPAAWVDASPHATLRVATEPDVTLEVLDWGGSGEALVFLAGMGNTAHAFDEFAPRFRDAFHVYGITRRGFGASSHPEGGYDSDSRARDILAVLDSVGIRQAVLVGHSIAGDELSRFAVDYPERVRALVYLDAYSYGPDEVGSYPAFPPQAMPPVTSADSASLESFGDYIRRRNGVRPPDAELHAMARFDAGGRLAESPLPDARQALFEGTVRSDYARIDAPALGVFAAYDSIGSFFPGYARFDRLDQHMARAYFGAVRGWHEGQVHRFRALRHGTIVVIPGANHYVYYSHPERVERALRDFLAALPR